MGKTYQSIKEAFLEAKNVLTENNLTIQEVAENVDINEDLLNIIFNTTLTDDMTRILDFLKVKILVKKNLFKTYRIVDSGSVIKIKRIIKPYCYMYYDRATDKYYDFNTNFKAIKIPKQRKEIFISEMDSFNKDYLKTLK